MNSSGNINVNDLKEVIVPFIYIGASINLKLNYFKYINTLQKHTGKHGTCKSVRNTDKLTS